MSDKNENSKLLMAGIIGGVAGLMLGAYIWGENDGENPISGKIKSIVKAIEQLEGINTDDANSLKEKLKDIVLTLKENNGKSEA